MLQVLSVLNAFCILGGTAALLCAVIYMGTHWNALATSPPWTLLTWACVSAGAYSLAWVLHLWRERAASVD